MASRGCLAGAEHRGGRGVEGRLCVGSGASGLGPKVAAEKDKVHAVCKWPSVWAAEEMASSPPNLVQSPVGSAESEEGQGCENYISGLAEQITHPMLLEDEDSPVNHVPWVLEGNKQVWSNQKTLLPTSPQSILTGIGCCNWDSSRTTSPAGLSSGVSSPPTPVAAPEVEEDDALDLLYEELLRLKMEDEIKSSQQQQKLQLQQQEQQHRYQQLLLKMRQSTVTAPSLVAFDGYGVKGKGSSLFPEGSPTDDKGSSTAGATEGYLRNRSRNEEQNHKESRARKQAGSCWGSPALQQQHYQSNSGGGNGWQRNRCGVDTTQSQHHHFSFSSSQQQVMNGSGMRAVFLGIPGSRESGGTGVFLPRRIGSGPDFKRKPACSTVLLPSRIVQALNLNVEDTLSCPLLSPTATTRRDYSSPNPTWRRNTTPIPVKRSDPSCPPLQEVAPNISLPTEWTY